MKRRLMMLLLALVGLTAATWADGGHAYVDLGLPSGTLWATENLVTTAESENDDLYQWGEAELPGFGISWSRYCSVESYVLYDSSSSRMAKYNAQDGLTELEEADDAASQQWGTEWCIPSKAQWEELMNSEYTTMEWGTDDGSNLRRLPHHEPRERQLHLPAGPRLLHGGMGAGGRRRALLLLDARPGFERPLQRLLRRVGRVRAGGV